jgi:hypothetical protein
MIDCELQGDMSPVTFCFVLPRRSTPINWSDALLPK